MAEFWKNPSYSCPTEVSRFENNNTDWIDLVCAQGRIAQLEAVIRAADDMRPHLNGSERGFAYGEAYDEERAKVTF
jgi:hypothetical protein